MQNGSEQQKEKEMWLRRKLNKAGIAETSQGWRESVHVKCDMSGFVNWRRR